MSDAAVKKFAELSLAELVSVLIEHGISFAQMRGMTVTEMSEVYQRIESGELKSLTQLAAEAQEAQEKRFQALKQRYRQKRKAS